MNIQEAKTEIARTYRAYMKKDEKGEYRIPVEKQRPVLLIGPPGIGKTAVMKQIAEEEGCGLVAYSMTHHTRQSAIGLPFISHKEYGGKEWAVTEYTMSEIVASIYEYMAATGKKSGILFLDEINCVSETLSPVILQLLQNKSFGNVPLPEDWIIVTAGNPPEYNKSVRDFDMVTLDRVKRIDVEADLEVWQNYALSKGLHPAVRSYFYTYPDHFYRISESDGGLLFVTARGWEDLSLMLSSYEEDGIKVNGDWFFQYLQHDDVARSFAFYYELYTHFKEKHEGEEPLAEMLLSSPEKLESLSSTECISIASMLYHPIELKAKELEEQKKRLERRKEILSRMPKDEAFSDDESVTAFFIQKRKDLEERVSKNLVKTEEEIREKAVLTALEKDLTEWRKLPAPERPGVSAYETKFLSELAKDADKQSAAIKDEIEKACRLLKACPQGKNALLYFLTDVSGIMGEEEE